MSRLRVTNATRDRLLADRVALADGWWSRLVGLLGRRRLDAGTGLFLTPCRGVHTFGMAFPLDIVLLDACGTALACYPGLAPNRLTRPRPGARHALELPAGTLDATGTRTGDRIIWRSPVVTADPETPDATP